MPIGTYNHKSNQGFQLGNKLGSINKGRKITWKIWNKGKHHSEETKRKIVETRKKNGSYVAWNKGKTGIWKHTDEMKRKIGKSQRGEKHWNWKGGKTTQTQKEYHSLEYKQWRTSVFERDNWTCQTCGKRGCRIEAHHIKERSKYPALKYDINNGVTLCYECHQLTKHGR